MNKILILALSLLSCVAVAQNNDSTMIKNQMKIEELKKRVSSLENDGNRSAAHIVEENNSLRLALKQYQDSVIKLNALIASGAGLKTAQTCLYFELGSNSTNYELCPQLDLVLNQFRAESSSKIMLVGHTDKSGAEEANHTLSRERAENLKSYLVTKKNISAEKIITEGRGSSDPAVKNAGRISSKCRRVEISLVP